MAPERLQKVIAAAGIASRREAERLITAGRVTVDGRPATIGQSVEPGLAVIAVDGRPVGEASALVHLVVHKPLGVTSTTRDRHAAATVLDLVPRALAGSGRLYPVGRLDLDSEGLIVLTNDGAWADRVLHPRFGVEREYAIGLVTPLSGEQVAALRKGVRLEEGLATLGHLRPMTGVEVRGLVTVLDPPPPELPGTGRRSSRAGSASSGACSRPTGRRSRVSSACGSGPSGSGRCGPGRCGR